MQEQRDRFCAYIIALDPDALREIQPLPYRRLLNASEKRHILVRLDERWEANDHFNWYPLKAISRSQDVLALQAEWFNVRVTTERLHHLLGERRVQRVWALAEGGNAPAYEMDSVLIDPVYGGDECYWTAGDMDWLLYTSHESAITVAGEWFVTAVKVIWPDWYEHVYEGWDYVRPTALNS